MITEFILVVAHDGKKIHLNFFGIASSIRCLMLWLILMFHIHYCTSAIVESDPNTGRRGTSLCTHENYFSS